jgi:tripartite-type tricarboxylate transporter receptor subunit TctC
MRRRDFIVLLPGAWPQLAGAQQPEKLRRIGLEGTVERFAGDGVMILFNDPLPCPDPNERAVRMSVEMRDHVANLGIKWRKAGHDLGFGMGIAYGYATLGRIGFEGRFDYSAIGTVVNLAARHRAVDRHRAGRRTHPEGVSSADTRLQHLRAVAHHGLKTIAGGQYMQHRDKILRNIRIAAFAALTFAITTVGAAAQTPEEFYKGRTVTLIVGSGAGAGYDVYGRMLARHLARHIPGQPHIIVQNMVGASGIKAANYMASIAVRDGSLFSDAYSTMPLYPLLDGQGATFDALKFNWIGSIARAMSVCIAWHTTNFMTLDDAIQREMKTSATGIGGWRVIAPRMLNIIAGTKFKVITGYGPNEDYLAIERGEVEGSCTTFDTLQATQYDWLSQKKVRFIAQFGQKPEPELGNATMVIDRIKNPEDRKAFDLIMAQQEYGRPYAFPPNVPADRVQAMRAAFNATMQDPEFRAEAQKSHLWLDSLTGERMQELVKAAYGAPPDVIQRAKSILAQAQHSN